MKRRVVRFLQKYVLNPPIRLLFGIGLTPPGFALLETMGRVSGKARRNPVGDGLDGDTFWIVAEHGLHSGYVRNLEANPRIRIKTRHGLRYRWRTGSATVLRDDDPRERQRTVARGHPARRLNALVVRTLGVDMLTVRIDLDPTPSTAPNGRPAARDPSP